MKPYSLEWYIDKIVRCTARQLAYSELGDCYMSWRYSTLRVWLEDRAVAKFEHKQKQNGAKMKEYENIRDTPEYLKWMEQELLNQIIQKKKLIDELTEVASDIDYVIRSHAIEVDLREDLEGIIAMIVNATEAEK